MRRLTTKLGMGVAILLLPSVALAAPLCWSEGSGGTLVLSLGSLEGSRYSLYGYRDVTGFTCQGSPRLPVTAEADLVGSKVILGMQVYAVDPGVCVSSRRLVILDLGTLNGSGSFRNDLGTEGSVSLTFVSCGGVTGPATPPEESRDIENRAAP